MSSSSGTSHSTLLFCLVSAAGHLLAVCADASTVWNGAEETLQDGSHMFSVDHETAKDVRAVINLEGERLSGESLSDMPDAVQLRGLPAEHSCSRPPALR